MQDNFLLNVFIVDIDFCNPWCNADVTFAGIEASAIKTDMRQSFPQSTIVPWVAENCKAQAIAPPGNVVRHALTCRS